MWQGRTAVASTCGTGDRSRMTHCSGACPPAAAAACFQNTIQCRPPDAVLITHHHILSANSRQRTSKAKGSSAKHTRLCCCLRTAACLVHFTHSHQLRPPWELTWERSSYLRSRSRTYCTFAKYSGASSRTSSSPASSAASGYCRMFLQAMCNASHGYQTAGRNPRA